MAPERVIDSARAVIAAKALPSSCGGSATSPPSAARSSSYTSTPSAAEKERAKAEASRTARGPKRAPGRNELPPSKGTPHKSTSTAGTWSGSSWIGKRRKLGMPATRGTSFERGARNLRASRTLLGAAVAPRAEMALGSGFLAAAGLRKGHASRFRSLQGAASVRARRVAHNHAARGLLLEDLRRQRRIVGNIDVFQDYVLVAIRHLQPQAARHLGLTTRTTGRLRRVEAIRIDARAGHLGWAVPDQLRPVQLDPLLRDAHLGHAHALRAERQGIVLLQRLQMNFFRGIARALNAHHVLTRLPSDAGGGGRVQKHRRLTAQQLHQGRGWQRDVRETAEVAGVGRPAQKLLLSQVEERKFVTVGGQGRDRGAEWAHDVEPQLVRRRDHVQQAAANATGLTEVVDLGVTGERATTRGSRAHAIECRLGVRKLRRRRRRAAAQRQHCPERRQQANFSHAARPANPDPDAASSAWSRSGRSRALRTASPGPDRRARRRGWRRGRRLLRARRSAPDRWS